MRMQQNPSSLVIMAWGGGWGRWKPNTSTGPLPEILKFHICPRDKPDSITSFISITWMCQVRVRGCWRLNNATKCQEAPRVALSESQVHYRLAVTSARKQEREKRSRRRRTGWVRVRERTVMKLGELERTLSPFSYCYHQQHAEGEAEKTVLIAFHSALHAHTHSHWLNNTLIL